MGGKSLKIQKNSTTKKHHHKKTSTDNWGNRLQVEVYVTLNLKTWEVWNTKITSIQFLGGGGWGNGKK